MPANGRWDLIRRLKVNVAAYLTGCGENFVFVVGGVRLMVYTVMRRITTFRSTTGRTYDGGPIRL